MLPTLLRTAGLALTLALGATAPGAAAVPGGGQLPQEAAWRNPPVPDPAELALLPDAEGWRELVARDRRVSFLPRTEAAALAELQRAEPGPALRSAALVALGAAGVVRERARLASWAAEGEPLVRCAAILALGELGAGVEEELVRHLADPEPAIASCALLALLRTGRPSARARVEAIAADASHPLSDRAKSLVVFSEFPDGSEPLRSAALLLRLRWEAAERWGLVDGRPWATVVLEALCADETFLDEVVLRGAAALSRRGIRDHLLGALLEGSGPARVRAAVHAMPLEVARLVASGLWRPTVAEWDAVLDEVAGGRLEVLSVDLLRQAVEVPEYRLRAAGLLARAGERGPLRELGIPGPDAPLRERLQVCEILGASGDRRAIADLTGFATDESPRVRAAALVARARLDDPEAQGEVRAIALDPEHEARRAVLEMLVRAGGRGPMASLLEGLLPDLEGADRARVAALVCLAGRLSAREHVRAHWAATRDPGAIDTTMVRGLARYALEEDLDVLRALFPRGDDRALDVELALGLLANRDRAVLPVLRAALWADDWDRSCLAGALLVEMGGPRLLLDELLGPPADASVRDLRRVGFAAGEWLGTRGLERLVRERRADSSDPALQGALLGFLGTRTRG